MMPDQTPRSAHEVSLFFTAAAMAGGLLWGMIRITAVVGGPAPYDRHDVIKAAVDAACALVSAFISALFVSPGIVAWFNVNDSRGIGLVYLLVGLVFWQVAPWLVRLLVRIVPDIIAGMFPGATAERVADARARLDKEDGQ